MGFSVTGTSQSRPYSNVFFTCFPSTLTSVPVHEVELFNFGRTHPSPESTLDLRSVTPQLTRLFILSLRVFTPVFYGCRSSSSVGFIVMESRTSTSPLGPSVYRGVRCDYSLGWCLRRENLERNVVVYYCKKNLF